MPSVPVAVVRGAELFRLRLEVVAPGGHLADFLARRRVGLLAFGIADECRLRGAKRLDLPVTAIFLPGIAVAGAAVTAAACRDTGPPGLVVYFRRWPRCLDTTIVTCIFVLWI